MQTAEVTPAQVRSADDVLQPDKGARHHDRRFRVRNQSHSFGLRINK
jgi:hypothetical protein